MLKLGAFILSIVLVYSGLFSMLNIIAPRFMMSDTINSLIGIGTDDSKKVEAMKSLEFGQRIMGGIGLVIVFLGFIVLFTGFWRSKKWAWWTFLVTGVISCIWGLIYQLWGLMFQGIILALKSNVIFQSIAVAVLMIGLIIPINSFFKKEKTIETSKYIE
jgi:hypothetical protein